MDRSHLARAGSSRSIGACRVVVLFLITLCFPFPTPAAQKNRPRDILGHIRSLRQVDSWRLEYSYKKNFQSELSLDNLKGESEEFLESKGELIFTRSGRSKFQGRGNGSYYFHTRYRSSGRFWEGQSEDQFIEHWADGQGESSFDSEGSTLEFDWDDMTYSFFLVLGEGEGIPVEAGTRTNIEHPDLRPTAEAIRRDPDLSHPVSKPVRDLARATEEALDYLQNPGPQEDLETFTFNAGPIPVSVFGSKLAGSFTDLTGGVLTWRLKPQQIPEEPDPELGPAEVWLHYHPPSHDKNYGFRTFWPEIIEEETKQYRIHRAAIPAQTGMKIFLIERNTADSTGSPQICANRLVPVNLPAESFRVPVSESESSRGSGYVRGDFSERYPLPEGAAGKAGAGLYRVSTALDALFLYKPDPESSLENPAAHHFFLISDISVQNGTAHIDLDGEFPGSRCDKDALRLQIRETTTQFEGINRAEIRMNGDSF